MRSIAFVAIGGAAVVSAAPCQSSACKAGWEFAGPSAYYDRGDDLKIRSAGAIQEAAASGKSWFVGSVNGGVWRTQTLSEKVPKWENVLDGQPVTCSSISALHVSTLDEKRVFAGCGGSTSSEQGSDWNVMNSGDWAGVMISTDRGETWKMTKFPANYYVTSIIEVEKDTILVSAQSHLYNATKGGIWRSEDSGETWSEASSQATFTLSALPTQGHYLATHARLPEASVSISADSGKEWRDYDSAGLKWGDGLVPFYTCATVMADKDTLVVAGMTVKTSNASATNSVLFTRKMKAGSAWKVLPQPTSMDEDSMPKDRMALLGDPEVDDLLYVAGNAGALAWRVNITTGEWTKLWQNDVTDGSEPHGDCRNYAWDPATQRLVLVSDGGIFAREKPREKGGKWVSLNGNIKQMEYLSACYDNRADRFVAGAQDNSAQVFPPQATAETAAIGFVGGDGTVTLVDNHHNPSRLYGTTQFLGVGSADKDSKSGSDSVKESDDADCGGLCMVQGDQFINIPIDKYFPEPSSFPFFVQPYCLNTQDPSKLVFWTNGTASRKSAFYQFDIHADVKDAKDIKAPTKLFDSPKGSYFLDFVSGGFTAGVADPSLVVGMSNTHLYVKNSATNHSMETRPLPRKFALPITMAYDPTQEGARILGPVTHGRTISLAVSPSDSNTVAVTGWPSVATNDGEEQVFLTHDGGVTWKDVTGNLKAATGVHGKTRAGGLLLVDLLANKDHALLVSTSNGVMVSYPGTADAPASTAGSWTRFGTCDEFPIVLNAALSYEHYSDTLVAATFGRGIYKLKGAKQALLGLRTCAAPAAHPQWVPEHPSTQFFPPQL